MKSTLVILVVGLSPSLVGQHTPNLKRLADRGALRPLTMTLPAVTCSAQSTLVTGLTPSGHGVVANGWYFRDLSEVWLWRQSNRLVAGEKIWEAGKARDSDFSCAKMFWWYNMYSTADWSATPRPMYPADGRKIPDHYAYPPELHDELDALLGQFPLFKFWGPAADITSSEWIARATLHTMETRSPTLTLTYLPHLDYNLQRLGITPVRDAVHINRALREAGLIKVRVEMGREQLDPGASTAFALADHQVAHVYVQSPERIAEVRELLAALDGVEAVLDEEGKRAAGIDHPRAGELVAVSAADRWFSYYYWLDDERAPDYARTVDIHRKPGYDPVELFIDPEIRSPLLAVGSRLAKRKLGMRTLLDVISLKDTQLVKGSHGRPADDAQDGPLVISSRPDLLQSDTVQATDFKRLVLDHVFA